MIRGLYTSALGMMKDEKKMEVISNNLANVNTNGYKKDTAVSKSFSEVMTEIIGSDDNNGDNNIGNQTLGVGVGEVFTSYKQGSLLKTDNHLDVALTNSDLAFFTVDMPVEDGSKEMYTRDGAFTMNSLGQLTTKDGYIVKGEKGPIVLDGSQVTINADGTVVQNGTVIDKLLIKEFTDSKSLKKYGGNLVSSLENAETKPFAGQVVQGSVEGSNVNSINEMVEMITVMRAYEANQKVLRSHDDTLQKAVNDVGRI